MPPRLIERLGMAAWIIGIDKDNPEHWAYAQEHGFWDMTLHRPFQVGDILYFWQAGGSLLGRVEVTAATDELEPGTPMPWNLEDSKREQYRYRVHFKVTHDSSARAPRWGELTAATGVRGATNFGPRKVPAEGEAWLERQVLGETPASQGARLLVGQIERLLNESESGESALEHDFRARVEAIIVIRRGQAQFRRSLLAAYGGRCAVTGTAIEGLLEAAHISPYKGDHTDVVSNGLLLRSDIHTLFDLRLLTVLPDYSIRVAPDVLVEPYKQYEGMTIVSTKRGTDRPSQAVLAKHNMECAWLVQESLADARTVIWPM